MTGRRWEALADRLRSLERLIDKIDRSVERIEIVTVVREPNTSLSADAYNGLRKQVIAAVGERSAHLHQLAKFDSALRAGATTEDLATLVREWLGQSSVDLVDDPAVEDAFDFVGPVDAAGRRLVRPAYVDAVTGRVVQLGIVERVAQVETSPEHAEARASSDAGAVGEEQIAEGEPPAGGLTGASEGEK